MTLTWAGIGITAQERARERTERTDEILRRMREVDALERIAKSLERVADSLVQIEGVFDALLDEREPVEEYQVMLETQRGHARYRVNPRNRCEVQIQPRHGARWEQHALCESAQDATALLLRLASGAQAGEGGG